MQLLRFYHYRNFSTEHVWTTFVLRSFLIHTKNGKQGANSATVIAEFSEDDCAKLEDEAKAVQELLQKCRAQRRELSDEIRSLSKLIKALSIKHPQLQMEISSFDTTREELTKRLPSLREQSTLSDADQRKRDELIKNVEKCKEEMASCVSETSKLEAEVSKLQQNIINAGGSKLKNQQKACEKAKSNLNNANKELNAAKSTVANSKKIIQKAEKAKGVAEEDLQRSKDALEQMQAEHQSLEDDAKDVKEAYELAKEEEAEKRKELESVSKECDNLKLEQNRLKCIEVELTAKIESLDKQIKDSYRKENHWNKEVEQLCLVEKQEEDDYDFSDDEEDEEDEMIEDEKKEGEEKNDNNQDEQEKGREKIKESENSKTDVSKAVLESTLRSSSLPRLTESSLEQYNVDTIKDDIEVLEKERDILAKNANMGAIAEYRKKESDYLSRYVYRMDFNKTNNHHFLLTQSFPNPRQCVRS